jgi:hypothetical protein
MVNGTINSQGNIVWFAALRIKEEQWPEKEDSGAPASGQRYIIRAFILPEPMPRVNIRWMMLTFAQ